ncbi:MAG: type II and III secretion system protein family protein [Desulfovibrionaceae bacterium]|nr:type II and III secretion system protein family protein [Desulfovibrionaceae bacterium]
MNADRSTADRARAALALSALLLALALCPVAAAAETGFSLLSSEAPQTVRLAVGKSLILNSGSDVGRVSLAAPDNADLLLISPRQIYLTGKKAGTTNLTLWDRRGRIMTVYDLEILPDVTHLKRLIHTVLPEETGIKVFASGESLTLSGSVSSAVNMSTALSLAQAVSPDKVVNLMSVGGVHQVMLEVRVAEMSRTVMRRMGFNFAYLSSGLVLYSFLNGLTGLDENGVLTLTDNVNAAFTKDMGGGSFSGFLDALKANNLVRILAEPNLICISGETANFLAGGEIPIPVPQGLGTTAIEYKPFGVGLKFTPTVLGSGRVNIRVQPEVSELDYTNALTISGFEIPAITSRRASTVVELGNGQSFAIAGLINDTMRDGANKFPFLGDLPVLGTLFRSSTFQRSETELIIIVTPHLVKPLNMAAQTLPTDGFKEPDDFEFYLLGLTQGQGAQGRDGLPAARPAADTPDADGAGFDGSYGHIAPR